MAAQNDELEALRQAQTKNEREIQESREAFRLLLQNLAVLEAKL